MRIFKGAGVHEHTERPARPHDMKRGANALAGRHHVRRRAQNQLWNNAVQLRQVQQHGQNDDDNRQYSEGYAL